MYALMAIETREQGLSGSLTPENTMPSPENGQQLSSSDVAALTTMSAGAALDVAHIAATQLATVSPELQAFITSAPEWVVPIIGTILFVAGGLKVYFSRRGQTVDNEQ